MTSFFCLRADRLERPREDIYTMYTIDGHFVTSVMSCMDLGILRSASFSYTGHVQSIALKVSRIIGMCMKLFSSRGKDFLVNIYL